MEGRISNEHHGVYGKQGASIETIPSKIYSKSNPNKELAGCGNQNEEQYL